MEVTSLAPLMRIFVRIHRLIRMLLPGLPFEAYTCFCISLAMEYFTGLRHCCHHAQSCAIDVLVHLGKAVSL